MPLSKIYRNLNQVVAANEMRRKHIKAQKAFLILTPIFLSLLTFTMMIGIFELCFYFINGRYVIDNPSVNESHPVLGVDSKKEYQITHHIQKYDRNFVDKTYTVQNGIRVTPSNDPAKDKFIAVFGCSYAYGWGSNDDETFPARIGHYLPEYNIYNFGVCGGATQHMYWKIKTGEVKKRIAEEEGVGVYMFWGFHILRVSISPQSPFAFDLPCYEYDPKTDDLHDMGKIGALHPHRALIYKTLDKSNIWEYFKYKFPVYKNAMIDNIVNQLYVSKKYFLNSFEKARFIVFLPDLDSTFPKHKMYYLKNKLHEKGIEYYVCRQEYYDTMSAMKKDVMLYPDGHPTPLVQDMFAQEFCYRFQNDN